MASAVSVMSEARAVAAFASRSVLSSRATDVEASRSMVSFGRASTAVSGLPPMQTSVSIAGRKTVGPARRLRVSAAEGSQTAESEAAVAEPLEKQLKKPQTDEGKSTIDIVREVIAEQLAVPLIDVKPDTKFVDLGADSLDTVEIMMGLEERFNIVIEEEGTDKIATVNDAANLIDQVKNK